MDYGHFFPFIHSPNGLHPCTCITTHAYCHIQHPWGAVCSSFISMCTVRAAYLGYSKSNGKNIYLVFYTVFGSQRKGRGLKVVPWSNDGTDL